MLPLLLTDQFAGAACAALAVSLLTDEPKSTTTVVIGSAPAMSLPTDSASEDGVLTTSAGTGVSNTTLAAGFAPGSAGRLWAVTTDSGPSLPCLSTATTAM